MNYCNQMNPHVSKIDFQDAFRIFPGHNLSWHLIDALFNIFDVNGTGLIKYRDLKRTEDPKINPRRTTGTHFVGV